MPLKGGDELGRGEAAVLFELAAKVRRLFETDLKSDVLDSIYLTQKSLRMKHPLLIEPLLRGATQSDLRLSLKLAGGDIAQLRHPGSVVFGFTRQFEPG